MSPQDTTFNLGRARRALGVKGPINPRFRSENFSPVAIVADFSSTFAPESIEARGVVGVMRSLPGAHTQNNYEIMSLGAGGIVVESIAIAGSVAGWGFVEIRATPVGGVAGIVMNAGGERVKSGVLLNQDVAPGIDTLWSSAPFVMPTDRTYVPPASYLHVGFQPAVGPAVFQSEVLIVFREIPEQLGAP